MQDEVLWQRVSEETGPESALFSGLDGEYNSGHISPARKSDGTNTGRIDMFGGNGANKRCTDSCTRSDGATDDDE